MTAGAHIITTYYRGFWEAGYRVFGLYGADARGMCECGSYLCKAAYKHPRISNWQHTPDWSEEQLDAMEASDQFKTGYGVVCNGLLVIDVDARNGGVEAYARLIERFPSIEGAGLIVQTGSGNGSKHVYFKAPEGVPLVSHHLDFKGIDFKSNGYVVGPGSRHASGNTYVTLYGSPDEIDAAPAGLIEFLRKPERHRAALDGSYVDIANGDLVEMLACVDPDIDYDTWVRIGMAVHHATGGLGFDVWDGWSSKGAKYVSAENLEKHWHSFGKSANPVTLGTLVHHAKEGGWVEPVTFYCDSSAFNWDVAMEGEGDEKSTDQKQQGLKISGAPAGQMQPIETIGESGVEHRTIEPKGSGALSQTTESGTAPVGPDGFLCGRGGQRKSGLVVDSSRGGDVAPVVAVSFGDVVPVGVKDDGPPLPFDLSGVDLKCPPGFVGDVTRWINSQCRRPRENLAVAGALVAMGNVIGLRYTDALDGVTANLFAFCVAGSRTGKEAVQQAVADVHRAAGIHPATHGAIKSEQEIVRNLIRHQAAFYVIDEVGIFLQKIKNAQTKGGALYLDGVIGMLMAAYSKADGYMLLTGDMKEEIRKQIKGEALSLEKALEDGVGNAHSLEIRLASIHKALDGLDNGLERPLLSLIGFTTPVTFDGLVDYQAAANGFIGRALIFNERQTVPRRKREFAKAPMPEPMARAIYALYMGGGGHYDMTMMGAGGAQARVEYDGQRVKIPSTQGAIDMLCAVGDWFEDYADEQKGESGLEALALGAYELVSKVSLILAAPEGLRTEEHVRWAFALIKRDIDEKTRLVFANDRQKEAPVAALRARILNVLSFDEPETLATIHNRLRTVRKEDVKTYLNELQKLGEVRIIHDVHKRSKLSLERFVRI